MGLPSAVSRQEQGLRQGDLRGLPLAADSHDSTYARRERTLFEECARQQFHDVHRRKAQTFGFQDAEFADDTNLVRSHLPSLRILVHCLLREAANYGFPPNNAPQPAGRTYFLFFQRTSPT